MKLAQGTSELDLLYLRILEFKSMTLYNGRENRRGRSEKKVE